MKNKKRDEKISSLMQDKTRGYELSEGNEDIDSSERDCIEDETTDGKRERNRSQDVLSATNKNKELNILIN